MKTIAQLIGDLEAAYKQLLEEKYKDSTGLQNALESFSRHLESGIDTFLNGNVAIAYEQLTPYIQP